MELFEEYVRANPLSNKHLSDLIQKFVLSDAYRNSDNQAKAIENELNRAPLIEPEKQFRNAIDRCIRTARKVRDQILKAIPFYLPDSTVKPPPIEERIETVVNPHQAGHCADLENLAKVTKHFQPGKYPDGAKHLELLRQVVMNGIDKALRKIPRTSGINRPRTDFAWFITYLKTPQEITYAKHCENIDKLIVRLQQRFCELSNYFSELTDQILEKRTLSKSEKVKSKPKKTCAGKGPQSSFKEKQRQIFNNFLKRRPITPSQSVITRAHQCWLENKKEWDEAAKRSDGYSCYKALAQAF